MEQSILHLLQSTADRLPDKPAIAWIEKGELHWRTWRELQQDVGRVAALCVEVFDTSPQRIALCQPNSYEWIVKYLASPRAGFTVVPLHESITAEALQVAVKAFDIQCNWSSDHHVTDVISDDEPGLNAIGLKSNNCSPDSLACIQPTSGTSGKPRGARLTHANLVSNAIAVSKAVGGSGDELRLSFLPFSHLYARVCDLYAWIYRGSRLVLAESRDTIFRDLQIVRPTSLNGVPYFYQKALDLSQQQGVGLRGLFGGEIRQCFSGGAALSPALQQEYLRQGVPLMSGYGLSETSPVVTASNKDDLRIGTVGRPIQGVEVRIANDGEVLVRGPNVMLGYYNDPEETAQVLRNGWLHTGDLGRMDEAGHLVIEGRKKEVLVLATGKNVSPGRIEALLCASPWIEQACVLGDARNSIGALIVPNPQRIKAEVKRRKLWVWSKRRALTHPTIRGIFAEEIQQQLEGCATHEQVRTFTLLPRGFSIERNEMTAKLSLRRGVIETNFAAEIERMLARPS